MFTVYVIRNSKHRRYVGQTKNFPDRLQTHNDVSPEKARFHRTTFNKGPWRLLFKRDFITRKEAVKFEIYLKTGAGRDYLERTRRRGGY